MSANEEMFKSKYLNNQIIIDINEKENEHLDRDIEFITLYFESPRLSGGCDSIETRYEEETKKLYLTYKYYETKKLILEKKYFNYKDYSFVVFNNHSNTIQTADSKLKNAFMLCGIDSNENDSIIELYVEYLVDDESDNEIIEIQKSTIFENTILVKMKTDVDFSHLHKRLAKKPKLRNNDVKFYEAFDLNILFARLDGRDFCVNDSAYDYLDDKFNQDRGSIWQLLFKSRQNRFAIINFNNSDYMNTWLTPESSGSETVLYEKCYNLKFVDDFVEANYRMLSQNISIDDDFEIDCDILSKIRLNKLSIKKANDIPQVNQTPMSPVNVDQEENEDDDEIYFELKKEDEFHDLLYKCPKVLIDFNRFLIQFNCIAVKNDDSVYIREISKTKNINVDKWHRSIEGKLNDFWAKNVVNKKIDVKIDEAEYNNKIDLFDASCFETLYCYFDRDCSYVEISGYDNKQFHEVVDAFKTETSYAALSEWDSMFLNFSLQEREKLVFNKHHCLTILLLNCPTANVHMNRSLNGCSAKLSVTTFDDNLMIERLRPNQELSKDADEWSPKIKLTIANFIRHLDHKKFHSEKTNEAVLQSFQKLFLNQVVIIEHNGFINIVGYRDGVNTVFKELRSTLANTTVLVKVPINSAASTSTYRTVSINHEAYERAKEFVSQVCGKNVNLKLNKFQATVLRNTDRILADFQLSLMSINATLNIDKLIIVPIVFREEDVNWPNLVILKIGDFFKMKIKFKRIPIPAFIPSKEVLTEHVESFLKSNKAKPFCYYEITNREVSFGCYKEFEPKLNSHIRIYYAKIERQLYNKDHPAFCYEIDEFTEPKINLFFYRKDDHYFNLYKKQFSSNETLCIKGPLTQIPLKIKLVCLTTDLKTKAFETKVQAWKSRVVKLNENFFKNYISVKFDIPTSWNDDKNQEDVFVKSSYHDRSIQVIRTLKRVNAFVNTHKE